MSGANVPLIFLVAAALFVLTVPIVSVSLWGLWGLLYFSIWLAGLWLAYMAPSFVEGGGHKPYARPIFVCALTILTTGYFIIPPMSNGSNFSLLFFGGLAMVNAVFTYLANKLIG